MRVFTLKSSDLLKCPTVILLPSHYREDGSCRHDEPNCEDEGCTNHKYNGEIFCKKHLEEFDGEYEDVIININA